MFNTETLIEKWKPVLEHPDLEPITDPHKRAVTAQLLENQEQNDIKESQGGMSFLGESTSNPAGDTQNIIGVDTDTAANRHYQDPVMISLIRRSAPKLIAYDIMGVQPMTGPVGLIFSLTSQYANSIAVTGEALHDEADTGHSASGADSAGALNPLYGPDTDETGNTAQRGTSAANANVSNGYTWATAMPTATAEDLQPNYMGFEIKKISVTAQSRALQAHYTVELAQDLRATHGLDAESELSNILTSEITQEINREAVRTIASYATVGAEAGTVASAGTFDLDVDANGRWSVEKFKGLIFQIEREANAIGQATRRGNGNILLTSSDVASALSMAGNLDTGGSISGGALGSTDVNGNALVGVLNGKYKVYVDPYSPTSAQWFICGYKGSNIYDAGIFYCPYVPLQMLRATVETTFQPKIAFKTRYGMVANPFATASGTGDLSHSTSVINANELNTYYRRVLVANLM